MATYANGRFLPKGQESRLSWSLQGIPSYNRPWLFELIIVSAGMTGIQKSVADELMPDKMERSAMLSFMDVYLLDPGHSREYWSRLQHDLEACVQSH